MKTYSRAAVIGLLSGGSVVLIGCFAPWYCPLLFVTAVLAAMFITTAKGIA